MAEKKYNIIAIIGASGCGKDSILREIAKNPKVHKIVSYTTRPKRSGEQEGVDYYFISPQAFADKLLSNEIFECSTFNDWFYGSGIDKLSTDKWNVGVFDPSRVDYMSHNPEINLQTYLIKTSDKQRLFRQLIREKEPDIDEIIRRYKADKNDFFDLDFPYTILVNEEITDRQDCIRWILGQI